MMADSQDFQLDVPETQVRRELRRLEESKIQRRIPSRRPPLALSLALASFSDPPREGFVPMKFFAEEDIQLYLGIPSHPLNSLLRFAGQTTSRKIVAAIFPKHQDKGLSAEERLRFAEDLPAVLKPWLGRVLSIIERIRREGWEPPPISVLNFRKLRINPWICRAESLCGQVADGTHRVLAYTVLGAEFPEMPVQVRVLSIHPGVLAVVNCLTLALRIVQDPSGTRVFIKKRFGGSAFFNPTAKL